MVDKIPSWVTIHTYDYADSPLELDAEDGYIDVAYEKQVSVEEQAGFFRKTVKILSEAGIQNSSEISINFDPDYQQLIFHTIRIIRGNTIINQLNPSKIKTIQQEKELNQFIYDGSLTAVLFLEDIRKGDIVEYSYTLKGANPVFNGKFFQVFDLNYTVPMAHLYYKLIVPKQRNLAIKNSGTSIQPIVQALPQTTIYEWQLENVPPVHLQDNLPGWYDPFSMVMVSEYQSWKEVNGWAMSLFPDRTNLSPALSKKIADIRANHSTPEEQVLAALRFVQDDIRYMGIEMGQNSHRPASPNKIFTQRFGDCKDKSYLLCTMLHALGVEAAPVLINTQFKKAIRDWLPTASAFDHTTVRVSLNGKYYWFDPTISFQRGDIDAISYPDYQYGLVIREGTDSLTAIRHKEPGLVKVREVFDIPDMSGNARLSVITRYTGGFADETRSSFNNTSKYEMLKTYRAYYAAYYEGIIADSLSFREEDSTGTFITEEYYKIKNLWNLKNGIKKVFFNPFVIDGVLKKPKESQRRMPYALQFPAHFKEEVIVNVPEDWSVNESNDRIENEAFRLTTKFRYGLRKFIMNYEYEALQDHISTEQSEEYMAALNRKDDHFSYSLSNDMNEKMKTLDTVSIDTKSRAPLYVSLFILLVFGIIMWFSKRKRQS